MKEHTATTRALDDFFSWYYRTHPVNATFIGVHEDDHRLPDASPAALDDAVATAARLRRALAAVPSRDGPAAGATATEAIDRACAAGHLALAEWELGARHFQRGNPCYYTGEATFGILSLFLRAFAPWPDRAAAATARMREVDRFFANARENVRSAPPAWIDRALRECDGAIAFLERGIRLLPTDGADAGPLLDASAFAAGAFRTFAAFLRDLRRDDHADAYACGPEALERYLRSGHFLSMSAEDIAARAEDEIARGSAALAADARRLGFASPAEALARLADSHPPAATYYDRYRETWQAARAWAVDHGLVTWPEYPIAYVPRPTWAREAAPHLYFLFYRSPSPFDRVPIVEYLVQPIEPDLPFGEQTRLLRANNDSVIKLNHVVHHGGLGHHVQNWYAFRSASRIGQVAAVDCASRIAMFCAGTMAEGWSCYTTDLMEEAGFTTPLENLSLAHGRVRQAARALVDVRLHTGAWTLDEAIACHRDRAGMPEAAARAEAVKNSMFPGAALMYQVGTDAIHALRKEMAARPGYSLRAFHDRLLSYGSVPVSLIAAAMRAPGP